MLQTRLSYRVRWSRLSFAVAAYDLNLRIRDWDLTDNIQSASVTMNNGSNQIKSSDANGWANYTGISAASVTVKVKYFGFWVNGTFTETMGADRTETVKCKLYDVTFTVQETQQSALLCQANVTVYNATSVAANKIKTDTTASNGQVTLSNLPNNTLTITMYGGTVLVGNTTKAVSSDGQSETVSANQNSLTVSEGENLVFVYIMSISLTGGKKWKPNKRKSVQKGNCYCSEFYCHS